MSHFLLLSWKDIKHPKAGGAEAVMFDYAKELVQLGHTVTWLGSDFSGGAGTETLEGIQIYRILNIYSLYFFSWSWIKNYISTNTVDYIIDEAGGIPLLSPLFIKNKKIIFFIHHVADEEWKYMFPFPLSLIAKKCMSIIISLYRKKTTITVSNSTKKELLQDFGFENDRVFVLENTVVPMHTLSFEQLMMSKTNTLVFVARLMPIKNVEDTIQVFHIFSKKHPDYILEIVGNEQDVSYVQMLKHLILQLGLTEKIRFLGYSKEILHETLLKGKALLVTSKKEGFGLVVLEANAYGIPAFGYDVPGLRDSIISGTNGERVSYGDIQTLAYTLERFCDDETSYKNLAFASYQIFQQQESLEKKTKNLLEIIQK